MKQRWSFSTFPNPVRWINSIHYPITLSHDQSFQTHTAWKGVLGFNTHNHTREQEKMQQKIHIQTPSEP